jgi:hypothetical protein
LYCVDLGYFFIYRFAGGCPAASHFSCFAKKSNQKKANPMSRRAKAARFPHFFENRRGCATRGEIRFSGLSITQRAPLKQCSPKAPPIFKEVRRLNTGGWRVFEKGVELLKNKTLILMSVSKHFCVG